MTTATRSRRRRSRATLQLHKPSGVIHDRVQAVGPDKFGIVTVDCAKARSKWMLCDFYGRVLRAPQTVEHDQPHLREAVNAVRIAAQEHGLKEVLVAVERTGNYHRPVQRAFAAAGYETRVVHPFATKQFRQPANPGDKTDDNDLAAMHRATVVGFGLLEPALDENARFLRLLTRHRRDLVRKAAAVRCQMREHLEAMLPGYAALFGDDLWDLPLALTLARRLATPADVLTQGVAGMTQLLKQAAVRFQANSLLKVRAWAEQAAAPDLDAALHQRVLCELDEDRREKQRQIAALELDIAAGLGRTPYVLLLAIPGINVVSAAEFAGEMGPISHYANANAITGRAGLYPARHQSDGTDRTGRLIVACNKRLRFAVLQIADSLLMVNAYFKGQGQLWKARKIDPRLQRVRVAKRFTRLAYAMIAGPQIVSHPCCRVPAYILDKLVAFHLEHKASAEVLDANLSAAAAQLPSGSRTREGQELRTRLVKFDRSHRPGLKPLRAVLADVLVKRLGIDVQSIPEV